MNYAKTNARDLRIIRRNAKHGLGYLRRSGWGKATEVVRERPVILSSMRLWDDDDCGDSYAVVMRVKVPSSVARGDLLMLGDYLADHGVIDTSFCQHSYDCCANFYPTGSGEVIARHGREIVIRQSFHRNV